MKKFLLFTTFILALFALAACGGGEDPIDENQQLVDEARNALLLSGLDGVSSNINLPTTGRNGATITWSSSNPSVISNTGAVNPPEAGEDNVVVTLTATLTIGEATAERSFEALVRALPESNLMTIAEALDTPTGEVLTIRGVVTTLYSNDNRASVQDETGGMFLFGIGSFPIAIGDEVEVTGTRRNFNGLKQLDPVAAISILNSNQPLPDPTAVDFTVPELEVYQNMLVSVNGYFLQDAPPRIEGTSGVNFELVDSSGEKVILFRIESEGNLGADVRNPMVDLMNSLSGGEAVNIVGALMGWFNEAQITITNVEQIQVDLSGLTDPQALSADIGVFDGVVRHTFEDDIDLPTEGLNGTLFTEFVSSHPNLIANDGSFVAAPEEPTLVTLTGKATRGAATGELVIRVDVLAPISIEDALEVPVGRFVYVTGEVVEIVAANSGFFIYDGTAYLYVRDTGFWSANRDDVKVGDAWTFVGRRDAFSGLPQITALGLFEESDETFPAEEIRGIVPLGDVRAGDVIPGALYTFYGQVTRLVEGNFTNFELQDGSQRIRIHHNSDNTRFDDASLYNDADKEDGKWVTIVGRPFQWDRTPAFVTFFGTLADISLADLTEAQEAELVARSLTLPAITREDLTLATSGRFDTSIAWTSAVPEILANDGTINPTGAAVHVTLTAVVTSGDASFTVELVVTVDQEIINVADALNTALGEVVLVRGIVTSKHGFTNTIFIQDEGTRTAIVVHAGSSAPSLKDAAVGDEVLIRGTRGQFTNNNNQEQRLNNATIVEVVSEGNDVYIVDDMTLEEILEAFPATSNQRFRVTDLEVDSYDNFNHVFFVVEGDLDRLPKADVRNEAGFTPENRPVGTVLDVVEFTLYQVNFGDLQIIDLVITSIED